MAKIETPWGYKISLDEFLKDIREKPMYPIYYDFIEQSNLIEGIRINIIQCHNVDEKTDPIFEIDNHSSACKYIIENYEKPITETDIKNLHKILMQNLLKNKEDAGEYRKNSAIIIRKEKEPVWNRKTKEYEFKEVFLWQKGCPLPEEVPKLMKKLVNKINNLEKKCDEGKIWDTHYEFETIHPFSDGNGRTGRLILNWLYMQYMKEFIVIKGREEEKKEYIREIQQYREKFIKKYPKIRFSKDLQIKNLKNVKERIENSWTKYFLKQYTPINESKIKN